jgi:hypothetical protein
MYLLHRTDNTRIVRPKIPKDITRLMEGIAPAAPAKLTYRNGSLLDVFTIFWGDGWAKDPLKEW